MRSELEERWKGSLVELAQTKDIAMLHRIIGGVAGWIKNPERGNGDMGEAHGD